MVYISTVDTATEAISANNQPANVTCIREHVAILFYFSRKKPHVLMKLILYTLL